MKKLYFILINIILLIALVISIDFCTFIVDFNKRFNSLIKEAKENLEYKNEEINNLPRFKYSLRQIHFKDYFDKIIKDENELSERISLPQNDNNKKSIIVFGCSFAEGVFLQADETLSGQLSKYTQRTAYNMGVSASSPNYMLYLSEYNKFYDLIKVQPEYIIYVIIPDHINRIYQNKYGIANIDHTSYIGYKEHNGKLVEDKNPLIQLCRLFIIRKLVYKYYDNYNNINEKDPIFRFAKMHFIQAKRNLEKHFPGAKFIILKHPQDLIDPNNDNIKSQFFNSNLWKELEQEGFIVIDLEEYVGGNLLTKEYLLPDGHPNAKLWEVVSKKLIKDFNM